MLDLERKASDFFFCRSRIDLLHVEGKSVVFFLEGELGPLRHRGAYIVPTYLYSLQTARVSA